ncbi:hypothetical protein V2J09_003605 [Rumex salicifolius]
MEVQKNNPSPEPISTVDPWAYLQITPNPDGTITRRFIPPTASNSALSKDLPINQQNGTWFRLYLPKFALNNPEYYNKLPIVVLHHGGGFVLFSAESKLVHDFCELLASTAAVLVASVEYRLAPEHRLPAAYDDAIDALMCIKNFSSAQPDHHDDWISRYGDVSSCFVMGSSAGGNIAYQAGLQAAGLNLDPLKIRGLILHAPFFGAVDRTDSERRLANDPYLPVAGTDLMWELALPKGADRDHEYSNPLKGGGSGQLERVSELGWKVLLTGCTGDPLIDRQVELGKVMEEKGIGVRAHFTEGGYHGVEMEPTLTLPFIELINKFIVSTCI